MSLLVSGVLGNEVKVFSSDDNSSVHLGGNDGSSEDSASDADHTSEWALLIYMHIISTRSFLCSLVFFDLPSKSDSCRLASLRTNVGAVDGRAWCLEAQTNVLEPSSTTLANSLALRRLRLGVEKNVRLLLESALGLDSQLGGHVCDCRCRVMYWLAIRCWSLEVALKVLVNRPRVRTTVDLGIRSWLQQGCDLAL